MSSLYAIVKNDSDIVENVILWDGEGDWKTDDGYTSVLVPDDSKSLVQIGGTYKDSTFTPIPAPAIVAPTEAEILSANTATFNTLSNNASTAMTPLLLSLQLGDATDTETALAKEWQTYSRALKAVDLTKESPTWPIVPE